MLMKRLVQTIISPVCSSAANSGCCHAKMLNKAWHPTSATKDVNGSVKTD